jgi:hypothetical protein
MPSRAYQWRRRLRQAGKAVVHGARPWRWRRKQRRWGCGRVRRSGRHCEFPADVPRGKCRGVTRATPAPTPTSSTSCLPPSVWSTQARSRYTAAPQARHGVLPVMVLLLVFSLHTRRAAASLHVRARICFFFLLLASLLPPLPSELLLILQYVAPSCPSCPRWCISLVQNYRSQSFYVYLCVSSCLLPARCYAQKN